MKPPPLAEASHAAWQVRSMEQGVPSAATERTALRVLVADDHELVRTGISCVLQRCGYTVIAQARDGLEAVDLWRELRPDVGLLDLRMPGLDGIGAIEKILAMDAHAKLVLLSSFEGDGPIGRSLRSGASGYLLKGISPKALCDCLEAVHRGSRYLTPELAQCLAESSTHAVPTQRELDVLKGVAQGLCNKMIARSLDIEEGTVKAHLKGILRKLEATSRTHAALIALRRGLVQM